MTGAYQPVMLQANLAPFDNPKVREAFRYIFDRKALIPDTWPNPAMFDGMGEEAVAELRASAAIAGRAGWYGLDSSTPFVEGIRETFRHPIYSRYAVERTD